MKTHTHRWIVLAAIISLGAGAALSHVIEPGVRVEKIMLTTNTPALRIFPAAPGAHPKALLAHGGGGSKEMLFRFGVQLVLLGAVWVALAVAGRLRMPRWSLPVVTGILAPCCLAVDYATDSFLFWLLMLIFAIITLLLLPSVAVGRIAARGGSRRDGDIAMAIFASYVIGQFLPLFY